MKRWLISGAAALAVLLAYSSFYFGNASDHSAETYSGIVEQTEYDLSFKIGGRVEALYVDVGDRVKKGQLLGKLENKELQAKVEQAKAALALAEANVAKAVQAVDVTRKNANAGLLQARAALNEAQARYNALVNGARLEERKQAEAKVEAAKTAYEKAKEMFERTQKLYEAGAVPETKVDEAEVEYKKAKAEYEVAVQQLALLEKGPRPEEIEAGKFQVEQARAAVEKALAGLGQVGLQQADVKLAQAQLAQAKAALAEAEAYLSYSELRAPIDGVVVKKNVEPSEMIGEGMTVLTIADPNDKWVHFYLPEDKWQKVKVGQEVTVRIQGEQVKGKIVAVNPAPQFAVRKATNHLHETDIRSLLVKVKLPSNVYAGVTAEWIGAK
ncbi:MAG: HlyD family efflux transporter periplasmic adaptor subunit [Calditerricola sp.]|jgi:Multidrug resistance efflux pump|nr:multidrug transporter [Bacillota bacterium]MCG0314107.1 HlyD family efflux transporter periplasmic adaptor subunit [Calditerricola sp.]